ncbi:TonB-dependent receptor [Marinoscillum furvescens]|uniref:Iron complex outermembrane receptor protein n=1 Tax=Marinoscillum furvescens DSM 4134 TaxID=1122208 RepID=A0A3D9KXA6_MARFU|nr:TonB-dependent receptor [Marinoscillum furvescens]RED92235.1 iron complex outermembrane receptor protein [Marinoscillum furvescens DSM 4134]
MRTVFVLLLIVLCSAAWGQSVLTGKVTDPAGEPLIGAAIVIHELDKGTITDVDGVFRFENLRSADYHLHISYVGYEARTISAHANEGDLITIELEPTSLELSEIVVESNHYKTGPKEHTLAMEIIDMEYLKSNRKGTLVNSLEDLPGVNAINTGVGISKPVIRGMSFNRVIVNDKGVKQEGQQWGTDHGLEIDMFEPGRVEVVKGPGSLMYGSDGLGGVLNIFPPSLPDPGTHRGSVQSIYKTNNQSISTSTSLEGNFDDKVYRLRFSTQDFGDYRVPATTFNYNSFNLPLYNNQLKNTAGNERNLTAMVGLKKNWGYSTLTVSNFHQTAGFFVGAIGIPRAYQLTPDGDDRDMDLPQQEINHFKIISNSNILIGKNWLEMDIGYQNNYRQEQSNPHAHGKGPRPEGTMAHALRLQTFSLNARYFKKLSERHSRIVGVQGQQQFNSRGGFEFLLPDYTSSSIGAFVFEEFSFQRKVTATAGLRFDYANRQIEAFEEPIYDDENTIARYYQRNAAIDADFYNFSGAVGLSYYPSRAFNAKWNLGTSFKVPTTAELSMNGIHHGTFRHEVGDSTLTSERGIQGDMSVSYQKSNFSVVVSPFVSWFDGFIYLAPTASFSSSMDPDAFPEGGQVFQYRQNNAFFAGGEFAAEYHPIEEIHFRVAYEYVYNYNLDSKLPLPFTPPASVYSELQYELEPSLPWVEGINVGVSYKRVFDQNRVDRNERTTPGFHLLGVNLGSHLEFNGFKPEIVLSAQNLTNTRYFNHLSRYRLLNLPEQGRNFVISLNIPFAIK